VDLLGSGPVQLGARIDWHVDFKTGFRWPPQALFEDIDYSQLNESCDVKMPWELSRGYQLVALGRAYALDGDQRFAREVVAQIEAWVDDNPWPCGVNWGRAMEVALRAVNWLWATALIDDSSAMTPEFRLRLMKSLVQHGRYIFENLERSDNNGNHYLSNGVGLFYLGVLFPELAEARAWVALGEEILWGEMLRQVHPDGVDFEKGIGYQGLVLEFWYASVLLADLNGRPVPEAVRERLGKMFHFALAYTRPDGTFPQIGDNDDGRLVGLDDEPVGTHCRHLAVGGAMLNDAPLIHSAGDAVETAIWLMGDTAIEAIEKARSAEPAALPSQAFPSGGFYVMRADDAVLSIDAGEVGMNGIGGHGHNDMLSFDLWAAGAPLLVDPGTYVYTADPAARQEMRATAAHNLIRVDGQEIARMGDERWLWRIEDDAHPKVLAWESSAAHDRFVAEHDGYARLTPPVNHRRSITFDKQRLTWVVEDELSGFGRHEAELFLHLGLPVAEQDNQAIRQAAPSGDFWIIPLALPASTSLEVTSGWVSRGYGHREPGQVLRYATQSEVPMRFVLGFALGPKGFTLEQARAALEASQLAVS
jgi:hypothetical protein